ncbi:MAG: threonine synthase [Acidobacteria bacterium]|nr:threonine synthase [Acidobacteriota bacterium]
MEKNLRFQCIRCGRQYPLDMAEPVCEACMPGEGRYTLEVRYDFDHLRRMITRQDFNFNTNYSLWRFLPFLPVGDIRTIQPLKVGCTPLYNSLKLADAVRVKNVYLKDEGRNPTGSFKDRASAVGISLALQQGHHHVSCASTGNMASSVACFAASSGQEAAIFVPETIPEAQISQILIYGARVIRLHGSYGDAMAICRRISQKHNLYNLSCLNPYLVEGQKTIAFELCEQLGWEVPDRIFVSMGDGQTLYGIYKGFREFMEMGFIKGMPQFIGVQAEAASEIVDLYETGRLEPKQSGGTIAESIMISAPLHAPHAVQAVRNSGGLMLRVSDDQILDAMKLMASGSGVFAEPAAAAALAGAVRLSKEGALDPHEQIVVISSGVGLKDIPAAIRAGGSPFDRAIDADDLEQVLGL